MIASRVVFCTGSFAQHVVTICIAFLFHPLGTFHRGGNVFTQDELAAHLFHGATDRRADHRFSKTFDGSPQMAHRTGLIIIQHATRQHQRPSRCVYQWRCGMPHMAAPIGGRDLVFDQCVDGFCIGHAQERLCQTHQRHALIGGQPVFSQKYLHHTGRGMATDGSDDISSGLGDCNALFRRQMRITHQFPQDVFLICIRTCINLMA